MDYDVRPFEGVGSISLGDSIEQVNEVLGGLPTKVIPGDMTIAFYDPLDLRVEFDADERCLSISTYGPAAVLVAGGIRLVDSFNDAVRQLEAAGFPTRTQDDTMVYCDHFGIALWREYPEKDQLDSAGLWPREYWHRTYS